MKLPKQWKHWCKKARIKCFFKDPCSMIGRDRQWRVNMHSIFECSCPLEHFDRWANSRGAEWDGTPESEHEFLIAVERLIEQSEDKR